MEDVLTQEYEDYCVSKAEEYLTKVRGLYFRQRSATESLMSNMAIRDNLKAIDYSVTRVTGGAIEDDRLVEIIERIDSLISQCRAALSDYSTEVIRTTRILGRMSSQLYASILESYYINGYTWAQTADLLGYSEPGIYNLRRFALQNFYDAMPNEIPSAI